MHYGITPFNYPGVTDPKLTITTSIKPVDGLNHASAVQYEVPTHLAVVGFAHRLPEDSNGLGYQNLVSIVFDLMSFRDKWMKVGKAATAPDAEEAHIPPLHLVLIEEPEAHLHAQVQQVFIKQAYQQPIMAPFKSKAPAEALANTFEDALVYENMDAFSKMQGTGLIARFRKALADSADLNQLAANVAAALTKGGKAEFAMDLLYSDEIDTIKVPAYINDGLLWLADQLKRKEADVLGKAVAALAAGPEPAVTDGQSTVKAVA